MISNRLNRRALLKAGGLALFAATAAPLPLFASRVSALDTNRRKVLVTIFQRFGMDGVMAVTPYADHHLATLRPNLMLSHPGSGKADARLELGNGYGLHPAFAPMHPLYRDGQLAVVHGVGSPHNTRSHSEAQLWWESGTPGDRSQRDGWLNRTLGATPSSDSALRAVALTPERPRIFYGDQSVASATSLDALILDLDRAPLQQLQALYAQSPHPLLRQAADNGFKVAATIARQPASRVTYPAGSKLGASLRDIAALIKADVGLQLAFAESRESPNGKGTWDTHSNAAALDGPFPAMAHDLSTSLAAFWEDLGARRDDVIVVTLTDFGRNVVENKGVGADHGRATAMFLLGANVHGGKVYGSLPERFERDALEDGMDLPVTTDYRAVLANLLRAQFGIDETSSIFPGWHGETLTLTC